MHGRPSLAFRGCWTLALGRPLLKQSRSTVS